MPTKFFNAFFICPYYYPNVLLIQSFYCLSLENFYYYKLLRSSFLLRIAELRDAAYSFNAHGEKKIVVLTNEIVDIELTKIFCFPNKFSVFPTNLFVELTKEIFIAFCLTTLFVRRTKILLRRQKKVCYFYIFLRVAKMWTGTRR